MSNISIWQILIILLVVALLFGMGRLPQLGKDLGKAIRSFRRSVEGDDSSTAGKRDSSTTDKQKKSPKKRD